MAYITDLTLYSVMPSLIIIDSQYLTHWEADGASDGEGMEKGGLR